LLSPVRKSRCKFGGHRDRSSRCKSLGRSFDLIDHRPYYSHLRLIEVHVFPLQSEEFAPAQTGDAREQYQGVDGSLSS
jgi:hypothetical protein